MIMISCYDYYEQGCYYSDGNLCGNVGNINLLIRESNNDKDSYGDIMEDIRDNNIFEILTVKVNIK